MADTITSTKAIPPRKRTLSMNMRRNAIIFGLEIDIDTSKPTLSTAVADAQSRDPDTAAPDDRFKLLVYNALKLLAHNALGKDLFHPDPFDVPAYVPQNYFSDDICRNKNFKHIGRGTCGVVFAQPGSVFVWKQALPGYENALGWEQAVQWRTYHVFKHLRAELATTEDYWANNQYIRGLTIPLIPAPSTFVRPKHTEWWQAYGRLFLIGDRRPVPTRCSQRIFPVSRVARSALIDAFCPGNKTRRRSASAHPANEDCIIRIYLGRKKGEQRANSSFKVFSLRNFPLFLDRARNFAREIQLQDLAAQMGRALAICHWWLKNDANDVEFVLGCVKPGEVPRLWMFDFDKVRGIEWDEAGMVQAVDSVVKNDPYFPKAPPNQSEWEEEGYTKDDEMLWLSFRNAYLLMARLLADREQDEKHAAVIRHLSERFIRLYELRRRDEWQWNWNSGN